MNLEADWKSLLSKWKNQISYCQLNQGAQAEGFLLVCNATADVMCRGVQLNSC